MNKHGNLLKLKSTPILLENKISNFENYDVQYNLPIGSDFILLNSLIGKDIKINFDGTINCIHTGKQISKSYGQGYSYESFMTLAECDSCMVRPSTCHLAKGTCRDESFAQKHCLKEHIIYLSYTSGYKIGITRKSQVPYRWIDQGALMATPLFEVADRLTSGIMEDFLAQYFADKTSWKKMLQYSSIEEVSDHIALKKEFLLLKQKIQNLASLKSLELGAKILDSKNYLFNYPKNIDSKDFSKIKSFSFDKAPLIKGKLMGIKGQYLIIDELALNIRKHQGYKIEFCEIINE